MRPVYPGTSAVFLWFNSTFAILVALLLLRPRSYAYTYLSAFLFLGFWLKATVHLTVGSQFLEPVGAFSGTPDGWDRALLAAAAGATGVILARGIHLAAGRSRQAKVRSGCESEGVPPWYFDHRKLIWAGAIALTFILNGWNFSAAFSQIGVNPRTVLPFHLNVLLAWLINFGMSAWFAMMIWWELSDGRSTRWAIMIAPILEGLLCSFSTLSRSAYLFHTVPYILVLLAGTRRLQPTLTKPARIALPILFGTGLAVSLISVQLLRIVSYVSYSRDIASSQAAPQKSALVTPMFRQLSGLFLDRWIGLEGVLAVSSYPSTGWWLFREGLCEDPKRGTDALYQVIARTAYHRSEKFTFLTVPGVVAFLFYSGLYSMVTAGMALASLLLLATECIAARLVRNPFLLSIVGLTMAYVVCQLYSPYLAAVFFLELWTTVIAIGLLLRR